MSEGLTHDAFLEGKLNIWQPTDGYRAGTDAVFLAAAVQAQSGESVFEIGCGVGTASLCLAKRINGLDLTGLEIQPEMAALARRNAVENKLDLEVIEGDIHALPRDLRQLNFDHVIANPPYFETKKLTEPRAKAKKLAHVAQAGELSAWVALGAKRLKPRGRITLIHLAESLPEVLSSLDGPCGAIEIIPIISRANQKAGTRDRDGCQRSTGAAGAARAQDRTCRAGPH